MLNRHRHEWGTEVTKPYPSPPELHEEQLALDSCHSVTVKMNAWAGGIEMSSYGTVWCAWCSTQEGNHARALGLCSPAASSCVYNLLVWFLPSIILSHPHFLFKLSAESKNKEKGQCS